MKNENKTVPETAKTVTISIEEYEELQGLKTEVARLNQQVQWLLEGIKLSRKSCSAHRLRRVPPQNSSAFCSTKRRSMRISLLLRKKSPFPLLRMRESVAAAA